MLAKEAYSRLPDYNSYVVLMEDSFHYDCTDKFHVGSYGKRSDVLHSREHIMERTVVLWRHMSQVTPVINPCYY